MGLVQISLRAEQLMDLNHQKSLQDNGWQALFRQETKILI